jgi:hypothetical protein
MKKILNNENHIFVLFAVFIVVVAILQLRSCIKINTLQFLIELRIGNIIFFIISNSLCTFLYFVVVILCSSNFFFVAVYKQGMWNIYGGSKIQQIVQVLRCSFASFRPIVWVCVNKTRYPSSATENYILFGEF